MDLPIGKTERGQNGMEVYNSKEQANERIESMENNCDSFFESIEELESLLNEIELGEKEYPK